MAQQRIYLLLLTCCCYPLIACWFCWPTRKPHTPTPTISQTLTASDINSPFYHFPLNSPVICWLAMAHVSSTRFQLLIPQALRFVLYNLILPVNNSTITTSSNTSDRPLEKPDCTIQFQLYSQSQNRNKPTELCSTALT